jgi:hypothetical protein
MSDRLLTLRVDFSHEKYLECVHVKLAMTKLSGIYEWATD